MVPLVLLALFSSHLPHSFKASPPTSHPALRLTSTQVSIVHTWALPHGAFGFPRGSALTLLSSQAIHARLPGGSTVAGDLLISPDKKYAIWSSFASGPLLISLSDWRISSLRIEGREAARQQAPWSFAWFEDSDHWLAVRQGYPRMIAVAGVRSRPGDRRHIDLGLPDGTSNWDNPNCRLLRQTSPTHFLAEGRIFAKTVCFVDIDVDPASKKVTRAYRVPVPDHETFLDVSLSPSGRSLAWLMCEGAVGPGDAVPLGSTFIALTDVEGGRRTVLGSLLNLPGGRDERGKDRRSFVLQTLPTDKMPISFHWTSEHTIALRYRHSLWTVDAGR